MARLLDSGSSEYISIGNSAAGTLPISMSMWVYRTDSTANASLWSIADPSSDLNWIHLFWGSGTSAIQFRRRPASGGTVGPASSSTYGTGAWIHVAASYVSSAEMHIWVNGSKDTDTSSLSDNTFASHSTALGVLIRSTIGNYFDGYVADYALWDNYELTDAEVGSMAAGYSARFIRPESQASHLPLIRDNDEDLIRRDSWSASGTPGVADHPPIIFPRGLQVGLGSAGAGPPGSPWYYYANQQAVRGA